MAYSCNLSKMADSQGWTIKDYQELSWTIVDYHAWTIMDYHGLSWTIMDYHGLS